MRVGLQMPTFDSVSTPVLGGWVAKVARAADDGGYASLWVMDHFFQLGGWLGPREDPMLEGYSVVSYCAAVTENVRLGLMVTGINYRYPAMLIKTVTTLDVLSGGRAYFGVGAAWNKDESVSLGLPFPPLSERYEALEETLRLAHQMWKGDFSAYKGKHINATNPISNPQPVSQPHPPILIGGMGEKKTLRLVAKYADACNLFSGADLDTLKHKIDVLRSHCEDLGRDFDDIEKTILDTVKPGEESTADILKRWQSFADIGIQQVIHNIKGDYTPGDIERYSKELVAEAAALSH